jgi:hypothetical protein
VIMARFFRTANLVLQPQNDCLGISNAQSSHALHETTSLHHAQLLMTLRLVGTQVVKFAPWEIPEESLPSESFLERLRRIRAGERLRRSRASDEHTLRLPGL